MTPELPPRPTRPLPNDAPEGALFGQGGWDVEHVLALGVVGVVLLLALVAWIVWRMVR